LQRQGVLTTFAFPVNMPIKKVESPKWYLLYTNPRAEKKVNEELKNRGFDTFLPLHKTLKQWSDRKKLVEEPLFKGYIFIYMELEKYFYEVLNVPGIVKFVNFERSPVVVDVREIEFVRKMIGELDGLETFSHELLHNEQNITYGELVEVISGPLFGARGKMIQIHGKSRVIIELSSIGQNVVIQIPYESLRRIVDYKVEFSQ
jgi:transcription antitermination factor NusG